MRILHICNDFSYSKVYFNLYKLLDKNGYEQIIFHPLRHIENIGKNIPDFQIKDSETIYSNLLSKKYKLLFRNKIDFLFKDLNSKINIKGIDIQIATTLYSDGAIAYKNYIKYNIPYIVVVRSTDIDIFLKYRVDLHYLAYKILKSAKKIVFINSSLKEKLYTNIFFKNFKSEFINKSEVIHNGIDEFWLNNINKNHFQNSFNFLFVGRFAKYKNITKTIEALNICRKTNQNIVLNLVGGEGDLNDEVLSLIKKHKWINYLGKINDKEELKNIYRKNDFYIMPSFETFGLSYIEALSQGLPILYSKGYGVDGFFDLPIGIPTNGKYLNIIVKDIDKLISNRELYHQNILKLNFEKFSWTNISDQYISIINENTFTTSILSRRR